MLTDRIIFVLTLVLAAVYFYATAQIPTLEIGDPLGPKAFPRLLGIGLLVAAGMLFMEMWRARKAPPAEAEAEPAKPRPHWGLLGIVAVWTGIYFSTFEHLGYILATTGFLLGLTAYFNPGKWMANVLTCVLFSVLSYMMFKYLGVSLPQGVLPY